MPCRLLDGYAYRMAQDPKLEPAAATVAADDTVLTVKIGCTDLGKCGPDLGWAEPVPRMGQAGSGRV